MNHRVASCLSDSYLRKYLRLLEKHCPDALHVWMPRFDGKRTSSATYDLVSGTALNLGSGAAFSGDGKRIVLDANEYAKTDGITTRPYVYCAIVTKNLIPDTTFRAPVGFYAGESVEIIHFCDPSNNWWKLEARWSVNGSSVSYSAESVFNNNSFGWTVVELIVNANEKIMRCPKEDYHVDDNTGAALYSTEGALYTLWQGGNATGSAEVAAFIYGGATTSAPLESLASVVKRGESGALLTEMFKELI